MWESRREGALIKVTRSPLSRIREPGSAKAGTQNFWIRQLTSAANVPIAPLLVASIIALTRANYMTVCSYLGNPLVAIPTLLLVLSGTWHMRIGMQVVLEDYIHKAAPKVINNLFFAAVALASVYAVLKHRHPRQGTT
jgi:succinate dehydrogenase / fumarate reductase membrane anchor subunit